MSVQCFRSLRHTQQQNILAVVVVRLEKCSFVGAVEATTQELRKVIPIDQYVKVEGVVVTVCPTSENRLGKHITPTVLVKVLLGD